MGRQAGVATIGRGEILGIDADGRIVIETRTRDTDGEIVGRVYAKSWHWLGGAVPFASGMQVHYRQSGADMVAVAPVGEPLSKPAPTRARSERPLGSRADMAKRIAEETAAILRLKGDGLRNSAIAAALGITQVRVGERLRAPARKAAA